jgi:hypothetical protein
MKTKKANKEYKCHLCEKKIKKGDKYARKSIVIGRTNSWAHDTPVPDWAWQPYRSTEPICEKCANPVPATT